MRLILLPLILSSVCALAAPLVNLAVTKKILPNGITVLIQENHNIPLVSYQSWFRVGSRNEEIGKTGLAHLFEHLMFTGTPKYPLNQFERILEKNGITHNAFTTHDCTAYYEDLPASKLELVVDLESDRLKNLKISQDVFDNEKKVVQEERLMRSEQSIDGMMNEKLWGLIFENHPYKNPVIGWPQDIEGATLTDAENFFKKYYVPGNLVIAVSGDVKAEDVLNMLEKYYGDIPARPASNLVLPEDPPLEKERTIEVTRDVRGERLLIGYRIGHQGEISSYALDLVALMLAQGKTSRLYKKLVSENRFATTVDATANTPQDSGVFEIGVAVKHNVDMDKVLAVLGDELSDLKTKLVSAGELQKTKMKMLRDTYGGILTDHGRAYNLALNEVITGSYVNLFSDLDKYDAIKPEDIRQAAQKYFNLNNRVVVELKAQSR